MTNEDHLNLAVNAFWGSEGNTQDGLRAVVEAFRIPELLDELEQTSSMNIETIEKLTHEGTKELLIMLVRRARDLCRQVEDATCAP